MSGNSNKPILQTSEINSLLDLKTEFLKRKKEVPQNKAFNDYNLNRTKNNILAVSKKEKDSKKIINEARAARIKQNAEALRKEEEERLRRQKILEEKTAIYDRMSKGEVLEYEDGTKASFLVDFTIKKRELETKQNEELKEQPSTSQDFMEEEKQPPLIVHYDHTEEKGRVFGPSHVSLNASTEEQRLKNIAELKGMSVETALNRKKCKLIIKKQQLIHRERINRLRARKGLPPLVSSSSSEEEEEEEQINLDDIPLPNSSETKSIPQSKPKFGVEREWDRGKVGYEKWIKKERDERNNEFKPPSFYY